MFCAADGGQHGTHDGLHELVLRQRVTGSASEAGRGDEGAQVDQALPLADEMAVVFARMSGVLPSQEAVSSALALVTSIAKETIPGTDGAGITLLGDGGGKVSAASTGPLVEQADSLQYELDEGPCLSAWERCVSVCIVNMHSETRWPRWVTAVQRLGVGASLSAPLVTGGVALGAMKVYSSSPGAYGEREEHLISSFAAQAAVLLASVRAHASARHLSDELTHAMRSRDDINMAKGIVMARERIDEETAFAVLVSASVQQDRTLSEVAGALVRSTIQNRR